MNGVADHLLNKLQLIQNNGKEIEEIQPYHTCPESPPLAASCVSFSKFFILSILPCTVTRAHHIYRKPSKQLLKQILLLIRQAHLKFRSVYDDYMTSAACSHMSALLPSGHSDCHMMPRERWMLANHRSVNHDP